MKVRVKSAERLAQENGVEVGSRIGRGVTFAVGMWRYCGKEIEVKPTSYYYKGMGWNWENWMLESESEAIERLLNEYESES